MCQLLAFSSDIRYLFFKFLKPYLFFVFGFFKLGSFRNNKSEFQLAINGVYLYLINENYLSGKVMRSFSYLAKKFEFESSKFKLLSRKGHELISLMISLKIIIR